MEERGLKTPLDTEPDEDPVLLWYLEKAITLIEHNWGVQITFVELRAFLDLYGNIGAVSTFVSVLAACKPVYEAYVKAEQAKKGGTP